MAQIKTQEDAQRIAELLQSGKIRDQGQQKALMGALREFTQQGQSSPGGPQNAPPGNTNGLDLPQGPLATAGAASGAFENQDMSNVLQAGVQGARQFGQGIKQAVAGIGENLGVLTEGTRARVTLDIHQQRSRALGELVEQGVDEESAETLITAGEILVPIPGAAKFSAGAKGLMGMAMRNTAIGSTIAGLQVTDTQQENLGNMTIGGLFGGALSIVPGVGLSIKNAIGRRVRALHTEKAVNQRRELLDEFGIRSSVGQRTGDPTLIGLESKAGGSEKQKFLYEQAEDVANAALAQVDRLATSEALSGFSRTESLRALVGAQAKKFKTLRDKAWTQGMAEVQKLGGDRKLASPNQLLTEIDTIIADNQNVLRNPTGSAVSDTFLQYRNEVADLVRRGATAKELSDVMTGLNSISNGTGKVFKEGTDQISNSIASRLRNALFDDIGESGGKQLGLFGDAASAADDPALTKMLETRANYRSIADQERGFSDSVLNSVFGQKKSPKPKAAAAFWKQMDPKQANATVKLMKEHDPESLALMKGELLKEAMQGSMRPNAPDVRNAFDTTAYSKQLAALSKSGLFDPGEVERLSRLGQALRATFNKIDGPIGSVPILPDDITINVVSRSPEFLARMVTRAATGSSLSNLLMTPKGQELLLNVAKSTGKTGAINAASVGALASYMDDPKDEQANAALSTVTPF